jgi:hypothetical protein
LCSKCQLDAVVNGAVIGHSPLGLSGSSTSNSNSDNEDEELPDGPPTDHDKRMVGANDIQMAATAPAGALPPHKKYHKYLVDFMNFHRKPGVAKFSKTTRFHPNALYSIRPEHIVDWFHVTAYGAREFDYQDPKQNPTKCRANTLLNMKKAVSRYMPEKGMPWNGTHGNPTRDARVNKVIAEVKKKQAAGKGAKSKASLPKREAEFVKAKTLLQEVGHFFESFLITCMMVLQVHIIARGDDVSKLCVCDLKPNKQSYRFALTLWIKWSKNAMDERLCPNQILLGANNPDYCVLIALALYLEE